MKKTRLLLAFGLLLAGLTTASSAFAQHRHHHHGHHGLRFGITIGAPLWAYHHYPYHPYYYPAPVVVQQPAPVYIEQSAPAAAPASSWWYYCNDSRAYYPHVRDCPGGWQRVAPQPQN